MKRKGILVFSAVIVVMFCVLGWFSRPFPGDDFLFYDRVASEGFIQAQISQYMEENGRVANHLFMDVFTQFGLERIYPLMASITSAVYILAAFSLIGTLIPSLTFAAKLTLSFLTCALTLCFTYSLSETFYWLAGMPYFWSCSLMMLALSLAVKAFRGSRSSFFLCMAVLFINATNLEQPCVFQGITAFLAVIFFAVRRDYRRAKISCVFWLASVAGFCVVYFAPGTALRMQLVLPSDAGLSAKKIIAGVIPALSLGVLQTFQFFAKPLLYSVILFMPVIAGKIPVADVRLSRRLRVWHIAAAMFAVSMFMQYMMGVISGGVSGLPVRGVSLNMWMMCFTWHILWVFFYRGDLIRSEGFRNFCAKWRWPVLILSVMVSANFIDCVKALVIAPEYAAEYDARAEAIHEQVSKGVSDLIVPRLSTKPELIFSDIGVLSEHKRDAHYYGGETLRAMPPEILSDDGAVREIMSGNPAPLARLAEKGSDSSLMYGLALHYDPKFHNEHSDPGEAEKWYRLGSENGSTYCMKSLSRVVLRKNFREALYWILRYHAETLRL